nr:hypothetical protein [Ardenticatena sp.]
MSKPRRRRRRAAPIRVKGLVAFTNFVRARLAEGIPVSQQEQFREQVRATLQQVEALCRQYGRTPADLPAPSRRAFEFLQSLDLSTLPTPDGASSPSRQTVRLKHTRRLQTSLHRTLWERALQESPPPATRLARTMAHHADTIRAILDDAQADLLALSPENRAFYQWLRFLSDPDTLAEHVATLRRFAHAADSVRRNGREAFALVRMLPMSHVYRIKPTPTGVHVAIHEGFLGAPDEVLVALARMALTIETGTHERKIVRAYVIGDDFQEMAAMVETLELPLVHQPKGSFHDLDDVFEQVNATYFGGQMPRPRLTWNTQMTHNKMAHYDARRDTVMVSITLDHPDVPDYVLAFVMYHELLHKHFGVRIVNGRRLAHTPEFRNAERQFARYDEAKAFLKAHASRIK